MNNSSLLDHPYYAPLPRRTLNIAHRGGGGLWPQNTMFAYQHAVELGADVLEMDIHTSSDGVLVVIHDDVVDERTNGRGPIHTLTLKELKALDAGYTWTADHGKTFPFRGQGITIPTLEEVFVAYPQMHLNIDMKQVDPPLVDKLEYLISKYHMEDKVLAAAFQTENVNSFRRLKPEMVTAACQSETIKFLLKLSFGAWRSYKPAGRVFQIPEQNGIIRVLTPQFVKAAHALGMRVDVWTVDKEEDMRRMIKMGVDGLISDRPDIVKKVLEE
ncbi:MAG TPA: glycerophosphodiester phosphodiesterase [Longilinea sp.]|nr:glycerophosphodiester phosphodiesterase [Longilinea sp.]